MKLKKILIALISILLAMTLFACGGGTKPNPNGGDKGTTVPTLKDLINYSSETKYYTVEKVSYNGTEQQEALLQARIDDRPKRGIPKEDKVFEDLSVPVKIFVNSEPIEIIAKMGEAGLTFAKMDATVKYLAGAEAADDLDATVATGNWVNNKNWSFFDDWDYLEKLQDREEENDSTDKDSDNVQRQKRKMMGQIFSIGMSGDEFARLVIEELNYAQVVAHKMHLDFDPNMAYDDYVKKDLSYDSLVYFKAFNQFSTNKSQTVQLYGYYYDYNKKAYDSTTDANFENELKYSHMKIFSDEQFIEYINLQRANYINSYRYTASFYQTFYQVHFQFQLLLENYDLEVFVDIDTELPMETALSDTSLKYSSEMKKGMEAGFAQQLILSDHLYVYSANEKSLRLYNAANTAFEQVKNTGAKPIRDEKEYLLNIEKLKVADYILTKMSDAQLSAVLKYHIMSYSGDMIINIQSEKKSIVLEKVDRFDLDPTLEGAARLAADVKIGRTNAIVSQLKRSYTNAGPLGQFNSANSTNWKDIRPEVKATLDHDYKQYDNGTEKLEAFENLLIKKKTVNIADETDFVEGRDDSALTKEVYDTSHQISRFLNAHETVLRYSIGQVEVELANTPGPNSATNTAYNLSKPTNFPDGVYTNGNNLEGRNMPNDAGVVPTNYPKTVKAITFKANLTIIEGMDKDNANEPQFLIGNASKVSLPKQRYDGDTGGGGNRRDYTYEFEGWYIDTELKFKIDPEEKIKYDLILYPGYKVTKGPATT